jgi:hypothetical protein
VPNRPKVRAQLLYLKLVYLLGDLLRAYQRYNGLANCAAIPTPFSSTAICHTSFMLEPA